MDWSAIGTITSSITAARDIAKGISALRDTALINERTAALLEQLLKAQEGLLAHNTLLLHLQNEHFETSEKLRKLEEAVREKGRYTLVDIGRGYLAYRMNVAPQQGGPSEPGSAQAPHYVCQQCFDAGRKSVLQPVYSNWVANSLDGWKCNACDTHLGSG